MTDEQLFLLRCLRGFALGEDPGEFSGDWKALLRLADIHTVTGILGYMVMQYPHNTDGAILQNLRSVCMRTIAMQTQRAQAMRGLIRQMNDQGIDHLLMKGFVVKDYYPVPELRTYGDIDFVIRLQDRKKCHELMLSLGFSPKTDWEPVYSYLKAPEYYEIHTELLEVDVSDKADYRAFFRQVWDWAEQIDGHTYQMRPEYHFLYLLTHIAKHIRSAGAGLRMYLDLAMFVRHFGSELDWELVQRELDGLALSDFANTVLTLTEHCFGVKSPLPLRPMAPELLEEFLEFTLAGGIYGYVGRDSGTLSMKKEALKGETVSRGQTLRHRLFPSASTIEARYTYLQGHHWLLPVAWVHRLVKTRSKMGDHMLQARQILQADHEEVETLRRLNEQIGL